MEPNHLDIIINQSKRSLNINQKTKETIINQRTVSTPLPNSGEWGGNVTKQSLEEQKRTVNQMPNLVQHKFRTMKL